MLASLSFGRSLLPRALWPGIGILAAWLFLGRALQAAPPEDPGAKRQVIGEPLSLEVQPATVALAGPNSTEQLVITGKYSDGSVRDLTPFCDICALNPAIIRTVAGAFLRPESDGETVLTVKAGGRTARVPASVKGMDKPDYVSFRHQVIGALNVGGCNAGACHGTPSGKNGFRLSLRGYDPAADYLQLTRDVFGRRSDPLNPEGSLMYEKALGRVPHEGGQRFAATSVPADLLRRWLAEGLREDPDGLPTVTSIAVAPGSRMLSRPSRWQQLAVSAQFSDGQLRDATRLTVFSSSDPAVASVDATGLVEFQQSGEVAILCRYLDVLHSVRLTYLEPRKDFKWTAPPVSNYVDTNVFAKLKMLSIRPAELCTDEEFIRRAFLDICGILPSQEETTRFLTGRSGDKRAGLIDQLLERPEYADFWTLKWMDVLRSNRKTIQLKGIHVYQKWLHTHIEHNTPFDQVVRELLTADGSSYANPPANYYRIARDPLNLAETTAQLFFGVRMQCAKCHNHPFERWSQDDYYSTAAFFARVRQRKDPLEGGKNPQNPGAEWIYVDRAGEVVQPRTGKTMAPKFMGGPIAVIPAGKDRRAVFAEWLTAKTNPFFARSVANRVWFHLNGRGIVDPVDDFRDSNPSANDALLDALAKDLIKSGFDLKHLTRVILNSRTYQLSSQTNDLNKDDNKYFSHAVTRLLTAEQLLDAICTATDMPEKYPGLPLGTRASQLPDGEVNHVFLKTFGQPGRELACECERESDSNLSQALQLINGPTINEKLRNPSNRVGKLLARNLSEKAVLDDLYMSAVSRGPSPDEVKTSLQHVAKASDKRKAWEDVHWALLNSKEFLFRH